MSVFEKNFTSGTWHNQFTVFDEDAGMRSWLIPYSFFRGKPGGKKITIISGIHGDELNGIRMMHQLMQNLQGNLCGDICVVPVANLMGYTYHSRYLPDRRDLNRMFPGISDGSEGARLAHILWSEFILGSELIIDIHSGSYNRWNFPHLRINMKEEMMIEWSKKIEDVFILHSSGVTGSLRKEALKSGIPVILLEAGETGRFEKRIVESGLTIISNVLTAAGNLSSDKKSTVTKGYFKKGVWLRADKAGLFISDIQPGEKVEENQILGYITNLFGEKISQILSPHSGVVLGMHLHPQVVPGRALFHLGFDFRSLV